MAEPRRVGGMGGGDGRHDAILQVLKLIADLLGRIPGCISNPAHRHGLLRPEEVAGTLGVTDRTLRRYAEKGEPCPIRIGSMRYYRMRDIMDRGSDNRSR